MLILGIILFGMLVGAGAQLILGRSGGRVDWTMAIVAGLVGSFVGGLLISLLAGEALVGMETSTALNLTLAVNAVLLFAVGLQMGRAGALSGWRLVISASATGVLGLALIVLKTLMH